SGMEGTGAGLLLSPGPPLGTKLVPEPPPVSLLPSWVGAVGRFWRCRRWAAALRVMIGAGAGTPAAGWTGAGLGLAPVGGAMGMAAGGAGAVGVGSEGERTSTRPARNGKAPLPEP